MGRCQLSRLDASPYQRGLLERGVNRRHRHQIPDRRMEQSMGYTAAVGTMLLDEVASLTERADARVEWVHTSVKVLERDLDRSRQWSARTEERIKQLEVELGGERAARAFMRGEMDRMRAELDGLLRINIAMTGVINDMRAAMQHGRNNPIVIDDDEESVDEGEVVDTAPVNLRPDRYRLVPVEELNVEETPKREIVDDREESPEV